MNESNYKVINKEREIEGYELLRRHLYRLSENTNALKKRIIQEMISKLNRLEHLTREELNSLENKSKEE